MSDRYASISKLIRPATTRSLTTSTSQTWATLGPGNQKGHISEDAYAFKAFIDGELADEWLKKLEKAFLILELTKIEKVQNIQGFMKGLTDDSLTRVHYLYGEGLT